jgi:hypothetical protein
MGRTSVFEWEKLMRSLAAMMSLAVLAGTPALSAPEPGSADATASTETPKKEKIRCKRIDETPSGSNLKKWTRVCKPASEWNPDRIAFERSFESMKERGLVDPGGLQQSGASPR